ncbi:MULTISPECIES: DUF1697 domain-containing protein [Colwellia]|jgi:uncharacterized protein (DUF1697 family)|uniref:DUF1697 domain-containing protein n=1 Tax=Colwellia psychrerythraea (strain 34H / ATCC BAA-681) TaxID=167879 RepID=Q484W6_COLP3|nr:MULTISPECIES: DUF1697 domain-containing protein [Colwellia]AAZ24270.1 hypothetical protein CPS_1661 [Colwellia psychrerythraea 34H]PKH89046.1 DUF1697 domain-containing protein [Colwellia sp. Bg11-28]
MEKYVILFRGINVGGKNLLPMKALVPLLEEAEFEEISSYIQSGNVVLKSSTNPADVIHKLVMDNFGFSPELFILNEAEFSSAMTNNPYQTFEGKFVHFYFCHNAIELNQEKMTKYLAESEVYLVKDKVFYLHAPHGIGRSKLVTNIEACLGQPASGRNLNTTNKVSAMLKKM